MAHPTPGTLALALLAALTALAAPTPATPQPPADSEAGRFGACGSGPRIDCVVDGDTFWHRGAKIRVADINAPETEHAACAFEARLGAAATAALTAWLNAGRFSLEPWSDGRDRDRYGRLLRVVSRGGASLGEALRLQGLAEPWRGKRGDWCRSGA